MLQEIILIIFRIVCCSLYHLHSGHWFCVNLDNIGGWDFFPLAFLMILMVF